VFRWDDSAARPIIAFERDCSICFICKDVCPVNCIAIAEERSNRVYSIYDRLNIPV
jgi:formate hydrogenlyase subunit 6/NADH:ubiquinone oxidoreductase subunit I